MMDVLCPKHVGETTIQPARQAVRIVFYHHLVGDSKGLDAETATHCEGACMDWPAHEKLRLGRAIETAAGNPAIRQLSVVLSDHGVVAKSEVHSIIP